MLDRRVISALVSLPLLFAAVIFNIYIFFAALSIVTALGLYEYFTAVSNSSIKPMKLLGIISGIMLQLLMFNNSTIIYMIPLITLIMLILLAVPIFIKHYNFFGAGATLIGILYVPLMAGCLYLIRAIPEKGVYLIWFVFIISWITDTMAYFSGMAFGKTKLCPSVSPKKTVEGSIGGIIGSTAACIGYGMFLNTYGIINVSIINLAFMGILGSVISQIGDLAASSIKRNVGVKDFGKIMPGHGGMLDRFDSILFVAPLIYYYISYFWF